MPRSWNVTEVRLSCFGVPWARSARPYTDTVVKWFDRTPREVLAPLLKTRGEPAPVNRVLLEELSPNRGEFFGQLACLQLSLLESAARAVSDAPTLDARVRLAPIVQIVSTSLEKTVALLRESDDPLEAMRPLYPEVEDFHRVTNGEDWYELLLGLYVTTGLLTDFYFAFAGGLPAQDRDRVRRLLADEPGEKILVAELTRAIAENPRLASRLALWGRRLVGDTLLQMYRAMGDAGRQGATGERIEPVVTEIVGNHTRRMDALGLTA